MVRSPEEPQSITHPGELNAPPGDGQNHQRFLDLSMEHLDNSAEGVQVASLALQDGGKNETSQDLWGER